MTIQDTTIPITIANIRTKIYDIFSSQTTDGSGEIDLNLTRTPTNINHISINCLTSGYIAVPTSLTGAVLTITVRKLKYDKSDLDVGTPENLPTGTTVDTTASGYSAPSTSFSENKNPAGGGGGDCCGTHSHDTTINKLITHTHANTYTETDMPLATTIANLNFMVIYE